MRTEKRKKHRYLVLTFRTTTEAMTMETYCMDHGIPGRMIPVPREISSGCGMCWRTLESDRSILEEHLPNLTYENLYSIEQ